MTAAREPEDWTSTVWSRKVRQKQIAFRMGFAEGTAIAIRVGSQDRARDKRPVAAADLGDAAQAHGAEGPAVEAAPEGDDLVLVGESFGQAHGRVHGLGAGGQEDDLVQVRRRGPHDLLGQSQPLRGRKVEGVEESRGLARPGLRPGRDGRGRRWPPARPRSSRCSASRRRPRSRLPRRDPRRPAPASSCIRARRSGTFPGALGFSAGSLSWSAPCFR